MSDTQSRSLIALGNALRDADYEFVTPTPETHRRVLARAARTAVEEGRPLLARTLRDVFGWNMPFERALLPPAVLAACEEAAILAPALDLGGAPAPDRATTRVRFATLDGPAGRLVFAHSAYPTVAQDAVFFGPDSYRFAAALARTVRKARRLVDVGCGAGVGGLSLAPRVEQVVLADISPRALDLARVNASLAGHSDSAVVSLCESDVLAQVPGDVDVVIANTPYLVDGSPGGGGGRLYRDGGGPLGIDLAARIVTESLARLAAARGGQLILYTGVPIIDGRNVLADRLEPGLRGAATRWRWEQLDPDVFGEELEKPAYRDTERLAVMLLTVEVD